MGKRPREGRGLIFEDLKILLGDIELEVVAFGHSCAGAISNLVARIHITGDEVPRDTQRIEVLDAIGELLGIGVAIARDITTHENQLGIDRFDLFGGSLPLLIPDGSESVRIR